MGKPFNLGAQPSRKNPGDQVQRKAFNPAETAGHAQDEDVTLTEAAQELQQPDFDVSNATPEKGSKDGGRPVYTPSNPWPKAQAVAHKPFKL